MLKEEFKQEMRQKVEIVDVALSKKFEEMGSTFIQRSKGHTPPGIKKLLNSMGYSASAPGKRFRPCLSLLLAEELGLAVDDVLPFGVSVEMIHCYSLIHDDLPCMDDDDFRRGIPSNHRIYGEDFALLAGDALLTESFLNLVKFYSEKPKLPLKELVIEVAQAAGTFGMIGGQAMDIHGEIQTLKDLEQMHILKTGKLIEVSAVGPGLIAGVDEDVLDHLRQFGQKLGLAFQVADDLLDQEQEGETHKSFVGLLGVESTEQYLSRLNGELLDLIAKIENGSEKLRQFVLFNSQRTF